MYKHLLPAISIAGSPVIPIRALAAEKSLGIVLWSIISLTVGCTHPASKDHQVIFGIDLDCDGAMLAQRYLRLEGSIDLLLFLAFVLSASQHALDLNCCA